MSKITPAGVYSKSNYSVGALVDDDQTFYLQHEMEAVKESKTIVALCRDDAAFLKDRCGAREAHVCFLFIFSFI